MMILGNITISILIFVAIKIKIIRKNYNHCLTYNTKNNCKNLMFYGQTHILKQIDFFFLHFIMLILTNIFFAITIGQPNHLTESNLLLYNKLSLIEI